MSANYPGMGDEGARWGVLGRRRVLGAVDSHVVQWAGYMMNEAPSREVKHWASPQAPCSVSTWTSPLG